MSVDIEPVKTLGIDNVASVGLARVAARLVAGTWMTVEESPEPRTVYKDTGPSMKGVEPGHAAPRITANTAGKIGIAIDAGRGPWCRSQAGIPVAALPVRGFRLLQTNQDILCLVEIILV